MDICFSDKEFYFTINEIIINPYLKIFEILNFFKNSIKNNYLKKKIINFLYDIKFNENFYKNFEINDFKKNLFFENIKKIDPMFSVIIENFLKKKEKEKEKEKETQVERQKEEEEKKKNIKRFYNFFYRRNKKNINFI